MTGLYLALASEPKGQFIFKISTDFFLDVSNLKYVKLLCNLFKIGRATVLFDQNKIIFYREDGTSVVINANVSSSFSITRISNSRTVVIDTLTDLTEHSKDNGYAHRFNREDFLKGVYTPECLSYLESYDLNTHQITCQFRYKVNEESLVLGHNVNNISVDKLK